MAQLDLKFATIRIADGYSKTGAVNNVAGYATGIATMTVDGFTGAVATGDPFTIAGDTTTYKITAHTETSSNTTSITFTPALTADVVDNAVITVGPHSMDVKIGQGNLTYSEKRKMEYILDRGRIDTVRQGDQEPVDVKLDFMWEFLTSISGDPPTVEDALKQRGNASTWVSSSADPCEPYAVDVIIDYVPPCPGVQAEKIILSDFRWEDLGHDTKAGTVSITGKCNIQAASVVRYTAA
jgi:hypothetical protein